MTATEKKTDAFLRTSSGKDIETEYGPEHLKSAKLGRAGEPPFTRGIHPSGYRGRLWTMRQYAGYATGAESNRRYRYLLEQGRARFPSRSIGARKKARPAQIALAWLLAQKPWIVPIPGTTKLGRLEENIAAVSVELTPDDLRDIDEAASKIAVQGARYPERLERMTGR